MIRLVSQELKKGKIILSSLIPVTAALVLANLAGCASGEAPEKIQALEQQLAEAPDASAPDQATISAMGYREQVGWLDPAVRQRLDDATLETIVRYLEERIPSKDVVATVHQNGDTIDCIPWEQQQSVRNLRARGFELDPQLVAPRSDVPVELPAAEYSVEEQPVSGQPLDAPIEPVPCPAGTVAVRRTPLNDVAAYGSLQGYLHRPPPATALHEHVAVQKVAKNYGNEAQISMWLPNVPAGDFSLAQIWAKRGAGANLETVEMGVIRWGADDENRLFIFTTNANYDPSIADSRCWNDDCGAFVQNGQHIRA